MYILSYIKNNQVFILNLQGYKLNEYGLFKLKKDETYSDKPVKVKSEKDIFKKLKLDYLEPHERG